MNRVEVFEKLSILEKRKMICENLISDSKNYYADSVGFAAVITGNIYNKKYEGDYIDVDVDLFTDYLKKEIESIEFRINHLLESLK